MPSSKSVAVVRDDAAGMVVRFVGFPVQFVNALRRCTQRDVSSLAVEDVVVHENSTCFWDEYIAHRIGLMPIAGEGEGGTLDLDVTNTGPTTLAVDSTSLVGDGSCAVAGAVPIVLLGRGDALRLTVRTGRGSGARHARFIPCVSFFRAEEAHVDLHIQSTGGMRNGAILHAAVEAVRAVAEGARKTVLKSV